jgi:hypothetical protein
LAGQPPQSRDPEMKKGYQTAAKRKRTWPSSCAGCILALAENLQNDLDQNPNLGSLH